VSLRFALACCALAAFASVPPALLIAEDVPVPQLVQGNLISPGSVPFHMSVAITERADPTEHVDLEFDWVSPSKWRRTITSQEFSQTLVVNGHKLSEQDSDDYFPVALQTLATVLVDPKPILDLWRPGDPLLTKANGASDETGRVCFSGTSKMCLMSRTGLTEVVGAPGHNLTFSDYRKFGGMRVARLIIFKVDQGDSVLARVTELKELKNADEKLFTVGNVTPGEKQLRSEIVSQDHLSQLALQPLEIIWPQVLDGQTEGETSYYVSIDRNGQVREIFPLSVAIERADDSARRQIMSWKFRPFLKDDVPVQAESILKLNFNTREYGPSEMLSDAEARKLASNVVEPNFPSGATSGSTCAIRIAVDSFGSVREQIAGECSPQLYPMCSQALGKWHFSPISQGGKSLPYRAEILFRVP